MQTNSPITLSRPYKLAKQTAAALDFLRSRYKKENSEQWLTDNFYMLEREGRKTVRELDSAAKLPCSDDIPVLFLHFFNTVPFIQEPWTEEHIAHTLKTESRCRPLGSHELAYLPWILRAVIIAYASDALKKNRSISNAIISLRALDEFDFQELSEKYNAVEPIFNQDPAGIYPNMDRISRASYRSLLAEMAQKENVTEEKMANTILSRAMSGKTERDRHIGVYLIENEEKEKYSTSRGTAYLAYLAIVPAIAAVAVCFFFGGFTWLLLPFLWIVLWEIFRPLLSFFIPKVSPVFLPRMEINGKIPESETSAVAVSLLLPPADKSGEIAKRLENLYLTNGDGTLLFGVIADLKGAPVPVLPEDKSALAAARREVQELNKKYGNKFFILVRQRSFSATQKTYTGWERKRGAITELIRFIKGNNIRLAAFEGDKKALHAVRHLIVLDADTRLLIGNACELIATAMHPLNKPVIDPASGRVIKGYGILAPSIGTDLKSAGKTAFSRIMSGVRGISPYGGAANDFYQDFFGSGIFSGKGVIDVNAFYELLDNAFQEEKVLSHDILEGSILRTAYISDIEMIDGVPSTAQAWLARQHRWIRGDWQNLRFLFSPQFSRLDKYRLFDNLRRSLIEPCAMLLMLCALFFAYKASIFFVAISILSIVFPWWFSAIRAAIAGGCDMFSRRYYSAIMSDTRANFARGAVSAVMLPAWGYMASDAVIRSLWRQFITKRNLLEWTTAADTEKSSASKIAHYIIPSIAAGIILFGFGFSWLHRLTGAFFICCPLIFTVFSKPRKTRLQKLSYTNREQIFSWAAAMWRFFEEYCTEREHHLPPDNVQESPVSRIAHRTSPTNIGLYLLSVLAAHDFGLIHKNELNSRISNTLDTIEKLPKWNGNLYNWYNTRTLAVLNPAYVSAVDSGNYAVSLIALKQGLLDLGLQETAERIKKLIDKTDLAPFYNKRRRLFHIGYDCQSQEFTNSYYDLLMSEARGMSYFATASRQVPAKHWGALGRTLARQGGHFGAVSWTGTMFEYYMPEIVLPAFEGSLGYESLRFAKYCQQKRAEIWDVPFGISESGFYAFDGDLNYQYKAHGVQKLGLKRGLDDDLVISPYSSFLVMPFSPESAVKNLKRLEHCGMSGRFGFFEAADFTPSRRGSRRLATVRSYMAHHVGMSITSCANTVFDNIMQKRFMSDKQMGAAVELLEEKIPCGAIVFEDEIRREVPDKPLRKQRKIENTDEIEPSRPKMHIFSNGEWTLSAADTGVSLSIFRNIDVNLRTSDLLRRPSGFFAVLANGNDQFSITSAPEYCKDVERRVEFAPDYVAYYACSKGTEGIMKASVHSSLPCEERRIIIKNHGTKTLQAKLLLYLEPVLSDRDSFSAHPAFSRLFLEPSYDSGANALIFERRLRNGGEPVFLAAGFSQKNVEYDTARERILERPYGIRSLRHAVDKKFKNLAGIPDPCMAARFSVTLAPKEEFETTVYLCAANSRDEVLRILASARGTEKTGFKAPSPFKPGGLEEKIAPDIISSVLFGGKRDSKLLAAARNNHEGQNGLWKAGISGDLPILLAEISDKEEMERTELILKIYSHMRTAGLLSDLVFFLNQGGDYAQSQLANIRKAMNRCSVEHLLGVNGGIHCIDRSRFPDGYIDLLRAAACYSLPENMTAKSAPSSPFIPVEIKPCAPGNGSGNGYQIDKKPLLPWCLVLANDTFGTVVSDCCAGYTWAVNSRENKLTPWYNDTRTDNNGEELLIRTKNGIFSLTNGATAVFSPSHADYFGAVDEAISTHVRISVPEKGCVKYCDVTFKNESGATQKFSSAYYTEPVLGVNRDTRRMLCAKWENNSLILRNPFNTAVHGVMLLKASEKSCCTCARKSFLSGRWDEHLLAPLEEVCAAVMCDILLNPGESKSIRFTLAWAASDSAVQKLAGLNLAIAEKRLSINIQTPDKRINDMVNTWLPQQILNSRIKGRTGFYQCGGAWGFRDQLQDSCAALYFDPVRTRRQILRAAACQFEQGDVLHWWHALPKSAGGLRGVRTLCSDDYLWLPYTVCQYIEKTGDASVLDARVPFITGDPLQGEHEKYIAPTFTKHTETVKEHCIRAIRYGMKTGINGIPLIGNGDWNDGMNRVGILGKGESVWLGMFFSLVLEQFAKYSGVETEFLSYAKKLKENIDQNCWDGAWYLRAFYDNGDPMGSNQNNECRIDSLPQSFSVIADMPDEQRKKSAIESAINQLVDWNAGIIKLFDPPFAGIEEPGYIAAYSPGLRENGGQYTHAAVWLAIAALRSGYGDGFGLINLLLPANHKPEVYLAEPYVLAADIYTHPAAYGRAGWTQYTGSSGWYYRAITEELLGIKIRGDRVIFSPRIPSEWEGTKVKVEIYGTKITAELSCNSEKSTKTVMLDGGHHEIII